MTTIDARDRDRVAANIALIKRDLPEFIPFFKDMYELGMTTGWRDITYVGPPLPPDPREVGVYGTQMVLEGAAALKERMKRGNH